MPIKERFARVWLVTLVVTYVVYFGSVIALGETDFLTQIVAFAATAGVQIAVIGVASLIMRLGRQDGPHFDERDLAIDQRATRVAYHALIVGMILVGCLMPFNHSGWELFHAGVLAIAVAEILRHGLIVLLYRRGWHG